MDSKELSKKKIQDNALINTQKQNEQQSKLQVNAVAPDMQKNMNVQAKKNIKQQKEENIQDPLQKGQELEWASFSEVGEFVSVDHTDDLLYFKEVLKDFLPEAEKKNGSFAMRQVGRRIRQLINAINNNKYTGEEKEARIAYAMLELNDICIRYKQLKFKAGRKPKNKRHKAVEQIHRLLGKEYQKLKGKEFSLRLRSVELTENASADLKGSRLKSVRNAIRTLENMLSAKIPSGEAALQKEVANVLNNGYGTLMERFESYLTDHISFSRESEAQYNKAYDIYNRYKLQREYIDKMDLNDLYRQRKKGGAKTWKELLTIKTKEPDIKEKEEIRECNEDVKVSALAVLAGTDAYKKYEKTEKDGKTLFVYEGKRLLTKEEIIDQAKAENRIIEYSTSALLQINEITILDMLMGIDKREEADFRYDVKPMVFKGKEVLKIMGVKVVSTNNAFTENKPNKEFLLPSYRFGIDRHAFHGMQDEIVAGRNRLRENINKMTADDIAAKLSETGTVLNDAQKEALNERLDRLKSLYGADEYYNVSKYADMDFVADARQNYKRKRILANAVENGYKNVRNEEDMGTLTNSAKASLKAKDEMVKQFLSSGTYRNTLKMNGTDKEDPIARLYKLIKEYTEIRDLHQDIEVNILLEKLQKTEANEKGDAPTGLEMLDKEARLVPEILKLIEEYGDLVDVKLKATDQELENDEYEFTNEQQALEKALKSKGAEKYRTKAGIRRYLWDREKKKIQKMKDMFRFAKGNVIYHEGITEIHTDDSEIEYYRKKKENEKGLLDDKGVETDYVKQELVDARDLPAFAHEPCAEDVVQSGLGNCWLMGALASIAEKNPEYIKNMIQDRGDDVVVRLFDVDYREVLVAVKKSVPPNYSKTSALWVRMIEKAITASGILEGYNGFTQKKADRYKRDMEDDNTGELAKNSSNLKAIEYMEVKDLVKKMPESQKNGKKFGRSYYCLTGGSMEEALKIITGKASKESISVLGGQGGQDVKDTIDILKLSDKEVMERYGKQIEELVKTIKERQEDKANKYVMIASSHPFNKAKGSGENGENFRRGAAGPHMYTLLGVVQKDGREMIKLRNPWGSGKVTYITQKATGIRIPVMGDDLDTGTFLMEISDFAVCFRGIDMIKLTNEKQQRI